MSPNASVSGSQCSASSLLWLYATATLAYVLAVVLLWAFGVEAIYGSPTPFYALYYPACASPYTPALLILVGCLFFFIARRFFPDTALLRIPLLACWSGAVAIVVLSTAANARAHGLPPNEWKALAWHLPAIAVFTAFFIGVLFALRRVAWFDEEPSQRFVAWFLVGAVAFAFLFAGAVAMLRGGTHGIAQAYERHGYEYISDIGVTRSILALFHDYARIHEYLSMHAKVHPPGPIALLWIISFLSGQDPLPLSLATMFVGALAVVPLYMWTADLSSRRVAVTCCILYVLMPSIVLFTATSADILFMPFTLTTLFLFWRALHRRSILYALAAGVTFALMSLLSFSLLAVGAYFAFVGLYRFKEPRWRIGVIQTAVLMLFAFGLVHLALRWQTGFDMLACFHAAKAQFDTDQTNLDLVTPRYPSFFWKFANPACWFFFAGVPVSLLFIKRALGRNAPRENRPIAIICALTFFVLSLSYLARGEGERSAMYVLPFVAFPAALMLHDIGSAASSVAPLAATAAFLAIQCWAIEAVLYTFW